MTSLSRPIRHTSYNGRCFCLLSLICFFFKLYSHFVYKKKKKRLLNVEWFRGRGGYEPFTENTLKSANVCVYLFVNTYTHNTPVQKRSVVHHLWPKKKQTYKKSIHIHIFLLCFSYEFMVVLILWLWIFVHLINRTTRSWLVFRKQAARAQERGIYSQPASEHLTTPLALSLELF